MDENINSKVTSTTKSRRIQIFDEILFKAYLELTFKWPAIEVVEILYRIYQKEEGCTEALGIGT